MITCGTDLHHAVPQVVAVEKTTKMLPTDGKTDGPSKVLLNTTLKPAERPTCANGSSA